MAREFKDSGIEWIGQIPKEWEVCQLKRLLSFQNGQDYKHVESESGFPVYGSGGVFRYASQFLYDGEAVLFGRKGTVDRPLYVNEKFWTVDTMYYAIPLEKTIGKYIYFLSTQLPFDKYQTSTALPSMTQAILGNLCVVIPDISIQQKIADYLDKVCGEVDKLVAIQETMIEELKAYKQSVITEAVTKGLNPNVPMRDSGIDWIGDIPEHWEAKKLKYIIDYIESGTSVNAGNVPAQTNEFGVLKTSAVSKYVFDATENKTVVSEEIDKVSCPVRKNTIIVSRMNTPELVGACGYVENDYNNIFLPDRLWQVHFVDTVYVKYIWYALRGSNIRNYYSSLSVGSSSSMQNISQSQFSNGSIPIPCDVDGQRAIVSYLDTKCSEIDALIALKQAKIEELKEYKKSVIYEYVTGKKEVC